MRIAVVLAVLATAACGVDGPPERPSADRFNQSVKVQASGDMRVGVQAEL